MSKPKMHPIVSEGITAYNNEVLLQHNPYKYNSKKFKKWQKGWYYGKKTEELWLDWVKDPTEYGQS